MLERSHYVVLAVAPNETARGIHAAHRDLARRLHPDRLGAGGRDAFSAVEEAYRVLGDPGLRRAYDAAREALEQRAAGEPEPLVASASILADATHLEPSRDALLERVARNFTGRGVPKGERAEALAIDLVIPEDEAEAAGEAGAELALRIGVPVLEPCAVCGGRGDLLLVQCPHCDGAGFVEGERALAVTLGAPPRLEGTGSLASLGIHNLYLRVRARLHA